MLDGGTAVGFVHVKIGDGAFEFDGDGGIGLGSGGEFAQGAVGRADAGHGEVAFALPIFRAFGGAGVSECFAEDLLEEISVELGFLEFEPALGFQVGPGDQHGVGVVKIRALVAVVLGFGFLDEISAAG